MLSIFSENSISDYPYLMDYKDIMERAPPRMLEELGIKTAIQSGGGMPYDMNRWRYLLEELYAKMKNENSEKNFVLSVMCPPAPAIVAYLSDISKKSPLVVWLDAHPDIHSPQSSLSGFIGGMPMGLIAGRDFGDFELTFAPHHVVPSSNIIILDGRAAERSELEFIKEQNIRMARKAEQVLEWIDGKDGPVYIHIDHDVLDPSIIPATRFPEPGGVFPEEILKIVSGLRGRQILGVTLGIGNPYNSSRDKEGTTSKTIKNLTREIVSLIS